MKWAVPSLVTLAFLHGCFSDGAARVTAIAPDRGTRVEETLVEIQGTGFDCGVDERFDAKALAVDWTFRARLGTTELANVAWQGTQSLSATVPAGLAPGTYDLTVVRPDGRTLTLPGAFTVTELEAHADCAASDTRVTTAAELATAVAQANATPGLQAICIDASLALVTSIDVTDGLVLYATPRGEVHGDGLAAGTFGIVMSAGVSRIENVRFSDFASGAVRLVVGDGLDVVGSRFIGGGTGLHASGVQPGSIVVRNSVFSHLNSGVQVESSSTLTVDNNTFHRIGSESVRAEEVSAVRLRNNIFNQFGGGALELSAATMAEPATANALSSEVACSACAFDASNPVVDCALVAPDSGLFELSPSSPCIDRGVDVGLPYQGTAPDLGALELR